METKLTIASKKYRGETIPITTRLPIGLVDRIELIAKETGRTRNEIVQMCLEYSIDNIEIIEK